MSGNTPNAYLTVRFDGPEVRPGRMRLDDFIQAAREFSTCAKRVALVLHQTPSTAKGRRPEEIVEALALDIVNFTPGSPAAVAHFERTDSQTLMELGDLGEQTYRRLVEGIEVVGGAGDSLPPGFDLGVLMKLRDIGKLFNKGVNRIQFTLIHRDSPVTASFDLEKCDRIRQRIAQPEAQRQTIDGRLLMADFKETGRLLRIYPPAGQPVGCRFPESLSAEVEDCIRQFVRVSGRMEYHPTGEPRWLDITDIEQIDAPPASALADAPPHGQYNYWENLPAAEHARRQGVLPVTNFSALLGAGAEDDWEGFDEAVEQWRAEHPVK